MKTPARLILFLVLAGALTWGGAVRAQDRAAPPAPPADQPASSTTPAAAPGGASEAPPPAVPAAETAAAHAETAAAPAGEPVDQPSTLRRLDEPAPASAAAPAEPPPPAPEAAPAPESAAPATPATEPPHHSQRNRHHGGNARVSIGHSASLGEGDHADAVVSIFGNSHSAGTVADAVVSVLGSSTSSGHVGEAVVSVLGNTRVEGGEVGAESVAVLGNNYVNGKVHGDVVAVLGNIELGPNADVGGDLVCVGGSVHRDPGAVVRGEMNSVEIGAHFGSWDWLHSWVTHCLALGRPLAFAPHLMWAWWLTIAFFALYLVLSLAFPRAVTKCAETLEQRPGYSILTAFLVALLAPAALILLLITIVGTPALIVFLVVATLFGKVVMLAWVGRRITRLFGDGPLAHPFFAVLIGGVIVTLLYTVPFVGFVVQKLFSWLGVGVVVYALIQGMKRNRPAPVVRPAVVPVLASGVAAAAAGGAVPPTASDAPAPAPNPVAGVTDTAAAGVPPLTGVPAAAVVPPTVLASSLPRAGFWIRIAASLLDTIVVALAYQVIPHVLRPNFLMAFGAYCFLFWGLRATTLGGIVCGLKIVRIDDRRVDWMTALVRALGGFLSLFAAGLGFIWVAFDDEKQSWHDKIAGTTIVVVPKGVSLV